MGLPVNLVRQQTAERRKCVKHMLEVDPKDWLQTSMAAEANASLSHCKVVGARRHLHTIPELLYEEEETSKYVRQVWPSQFHLDIVSGWRISACCGEF